MNTNLLYQDPPDPESPYLLQTILECCEGAVKGGCSFAWATRMGVMLFLEDPTFRKFVAIHQFELVVGIDSVTNVAAIDALVESTRRNPNVRVQIFLHSRPGTLFHPKMCWFKRQNGGRLVVGSGNLTSGGLRGNWEAFTLSELTRAETAKIESEWNAWRIRHQHVLLDLADPVVRRRAAENRSVFVTRGPGGATRLIPAAGDDEGVPAPDPGNPVLIAEIPRSGDRWKQANFPQEYYTGFFGARIGSQRRILLQSVSADGTLGELESRPSIEVRSQNYRFELAAAGGLEYPREGRPIGIFVRVPSGRFLYRLLLPGDPGFDNVKELLETRTRAQGNALKRVQIEAAVLHGAWEAAPFWTLRIVEEP
jgi:hypothetical protein